MQDEEMDIKIKEAASQHHPPYNDKAWMKMEKLLDKYLPLKKDRKRWLVFLLLFLLLDAAILMAILKPWRSASPINNETAKIKIPPVDTDRPSSNSSGTETIPSYNAATLDQLQDNQQVVTVKDRVVNSTTPIGVDPKTVAANPPVSSLAITGYSSPQSKKSLNRLSDQGNSGIRSGKKPVTQKGKTRSSYTQPEMTINNSEQSLVSNSPYSNVKDIMNQAVTNKTKEQPEEQNKIQPIEESENEKKALVKSDPDKKNEEKKTGKPKDNKNNLNKVAKTKRGFGNNFAITTSLGGDMSFISLDKPGKITLLYGAGLSYGFTKHFSVSAGFYVSNKVYSATPEQYNNTIYPNLTKIDGECKIYQLPLSISYHFGQRKKHGWSGSAGLTTLLMKKEVYDYEYKNPSGQYYYYTKKLNDENKHYFSVLSLSAGYEYHPGNRVSFSGGPFVNIPLKGIGFGKMKLNSAGLQLNLAVKPFAKKK